MNLIIKASSLVIFRDLLKDKVFSLFIKLLDSIEYSNEDGIIREFQMKRYSKFVNALYKNGGNFTEYVLNFILEDENFYIVNYSKNRNTDKNIEECLKNELSIIQEISTMSPQKIKNMLTYNHETGEYMQIPYFLPAWNISENIDFYDEYTRRIADIENYGYGIYAKYYMFIIRNGAVVPVKNPDSIKLENMIGYELERKAVIDNTEALLSGKPASNVLLYGDAGTGKSSTVKAIANAYKDKGLRIIEISKKQLREIPFIMDSLSINPLKFIIFIDDLSFAKDDDEFGELKAILEGSVSARTSNIVIYATSNRRHLVKETFSDRDGDDIHHNDTVQELISLSERFGLTVNFSKPDKKNFIDIVTGLAEQYGLNVPHDELVREAEKFVLRKSGRSPRAAKHFIEYMKTKEN